MTTELELDKNTPKLSSLTSVTTLSKYLALLLFVTLPFIGGWVGYTYAPEKIVTGGQTVANGYDIQAQEQEGYLALQQPSMIDTSLNEDGSVRNDVAASGLSTETKIYFFQNKCEEDGEFCFVVNSINADSFVSEKITSLSEGNLDFYGKIDEKNFFRTNFVDKIYLANLDTPTLFIKEITIDELGLASDYELLSTKSINGSLYIIAVQYGELEPLNQYQTFRRVKDSKYIKFDLDTNTAKNIPLSFFPDSQNHDFVGSEKNYIYLEDYDNDTGSMTIYTLDLVSEKVVNSRYVAGCTEETQGFSTPCEITYSEGAKLRTHQCGDTIISRLYTQDDTSIFKLENTRTGLSTTINGIFGMCR